MLEPSTESMTLCRHVTCRPWLRSLVLLESSLMVYCAIRAASCLSVSGGFRRDIVGGVAEEELGGVNNSALVDPNGHLRAPLVDQVHYELVPQPAWNNLVYWYGEPKYPLPRTVIVRGEQKEATVALYPLRITVFADASLVRPYHLPVPLRGAFIGSSTLEPGTLGRGNMDHTCFMNLNGVFQEELNPDNPLGMHGAIAAEAFGALLHRIWAPSGPSTSYSPREFKKQLQRFAPQFSGYQQHNSQELAAFLLNGQHEDLNRVIKKPYVEKPDWTGGGTMELVQLAQKAWDGHMLVCPECQKVSITFDPFIGNNIFYVPWDVNKPHLKIPVVIDRDASFKDLRQLLGRWMGVSPDNPLTPETFSHKFYKNLDDVLLCGEMANNDNIVCYELPCDAQQSRTYKKQPDDPFIVPVYLCYKPPTAPRYNGSSHHFVGTTHLYDAVVGRLERWANNAADLFAWKVAPSGVQTIKANGDVVEHRPEALEGDITDEKGVLVAEDDDVAMEIVIDGEPNRLGPKRDLFQLTREVRSAKETHPELCFYFSDLHRSEDARWEHWELFLHLEFEESQREAEQKKEQGHLIAGLSGRQFDLWKAPDVLVVHLKRFSSSRTLRDKIDAFIDFPVEGLDLGDMIGERAAANGSNSYLDFFSIAVPRTALQAPSNCFRNVSPDHSAQIRSVWPIIRNCRLVYSDQPLVEFACLCVIRVIGSFHRSSVENLEALVDSDLVLASVRIHRGLRVYKLQTVCAHPVSAQSRGSQIGQPAQYIRFIYNRVVLENASVRAAAVASMAKFDVNSTDEKLNKSPLFYLIGAWMDVDDEVRDRAAMYLKVFKTQAPVEPYIKEDSVLSLAALESKLVSYVKGPSASRTVRRRIHSQDQPFPSRRRIRPIKHLGHHRRTRHPKKLPRHRRLHLRPRLNPLTYAEHLAAVPAFASYGAILNSSAKPLPLTETETEYQVTCVKHVFQEHIVFQLSNTPPDTVLEGVAMAMQTEDAGLTQDFVLPIASLSAVTSPGVAYVSFTHDEPEDYATAAFPVHAPLHANLSSRCWVWSRWVERRFLRRRRSHDLVANTSSAGDWLSLTVPASKADEMLAAKYETFKHVASATYARTLSFSLPTEVADHVTTPAAAVAANLSADATKAPLHRSPGALTRSPPPLPPSIAVAGFIDQIAQTGDRKTFLESFRTDISSSTTFKLQTLDGGKNTRSTSKAGIEANLDIQYTIGVATGVPAYFVSVGDSFQDGDLGGFLDIVNFLSDEEM
ncbi:hypothetical protein DFH06DRAFT_1408416 [Mycena polygramma]|nr:hypothetical protein DFH06DRAFT_1408416 [Mycena polygramma]